MKKIQLIGNPNRDYDYADKYGTPARSPEMIALTNNWGDNTINMDVDLATIGEADIQAIIGDILSSERVGTVVPEEVREFINKYMAQITEHIYDKYNRRYQGEILREIYSLYERRPFEPKLLFPSAYRNRSNQAFVVYAFGHKRKSFDHEGLDIRAPMNTEIWACADGEIVKVVTVDRGSYGKYVKIRHEFFGEVYYTYYAHLNDAVVTVGDYVLQGQLVGYSGNSGNSSGPHLHLTLIKRDDLSMVRGVRLKGVIDPERFLYLADDSKMKVLYR